MPAPEFLRVALVALMLTGGAVFAEEAPGDIALGRMLEMPAHGALAALRADPGTELAPFATDGCSGGLSSTWEIVAQSFPDFAGTHDQKPPWEACCVTHDRAYHDAGPDPEPEASYEARLVADQKLWSCVVATGQAREAELAVDYDVSRDQVARAYNAIAGAMFSAVRLGGLPCSGLPWRWGYGYPDCTLAGFVPGLAGQD